jgi:hypothetical protein
MMCLNWFSPQIVNQENKMENQEVLKAIAVLADKTGRYHERLMAVERDNLRLEKELKDHKNGCGCENSSEKKDMSFTVGGNEAEAECESCGA